MKVMDDINTVIDALKESKLFADIPPHGIESMLACLRARKKDYSKGEMVHLEGSVVNDIGVVLSGRGRSIKVDVSGKITTLTLLRKGDFIGVILAASRERKSPVSIEATDNLSVMFFPIDSVMGRCAKLCGTHDILLRNVLDGIAEKALVLQARNDCLIKPTVREKVMAYLSNMASENASRAFTLPVDRSGMAEYLNVERSALSRELSRMKADGLIDFFKSDFKLL